MTRAPRTLGLLGATMAVAACGSEPPPSTGGTDVEPGPFGRGLAVIETDYSSTNVALFGFDGASLSPSFTSSKDSLLSWDIATSSMPMTGEDVVLLDRGRHLVTWVGVKTGEVRTQLHADADGLAQNPWDYLEIAPDKAYVLRYDPVTGKGPHGDVVVVNPRAATVTSGVGKRVDLAASLPIADGDRVHPARGAIVGDRAYITTVNATKEYVYSDSMVVALDTATDEVVGSLVLPGLHDCNGIAVSPDGGEIALVCAGDLDAYGTTSLGAAGVVRISVPDLTEKKRYPASDLGAGVPGFSLSYATSTLLLATLVGNVLDGVDDAAVAIDLDSGDSHEIHRAGPVQLGAVLCPSRLDAPDDRAPEACFLTDADAFSVVRFPIQKGALGMPTEISANEGRGRPPRYLGQF